MVLIEDRPMPEGLKKAINNNFMYTLKVVEARRDDDPEHNAVFYVPTKTSYHECNCVFVNHVELEKESMSEKEILSSVNAYIESDHVGLVGSPGSAGRTVNVFTLLQGDGSYTIIAGKDVTCYLMQNGKTIERF